MRGIFIDCKNEAQNRWWRTARKFVLVVEERDIIETATGRRIGTIFGVIGPFANFIMNENVKRFIKNPKPITVEVD